MSKQKMPLLLVDWDDHWSFSEPCWRNIEEFWNSEESHHCRTVGYLIKETKKSITLLQTLALTSTGEVMSATGDITILKSCVKKRKTIKESK